MQKLSRHKIFSLCLLIFYSIYLNAQDMNTPYSVYGIGDLEHRYYNMNSGMGYTGLALKTSLQGYGNNPASLIGLDKRFFVFDLNIAGKTVNYAGNSITEDNRSNRELTIKKITLSSRITSFWSSGIGMQPFSNVSYSFLNTKTVQGSDELYQISYKGDGGLHDFFWTNSFAITKRLSVGIKASLISGSSNQTETITGSSVIETMRSDYYGNGRLEYGVIYAHPISKTWELSLGGNFSKKTKMNYERSISVKENETSLFEDEFISYNKFNLPLSYGAGLALKNKANTITIAADYKSDRWSDLKVRGTGWKLVNSDRISAGAEFSSFTQQFNRSIQKRSFQFGGFLNRSYLEANNNQIIEWGITSGVTRAYKNGLAIGLSVEGGVRGTTSANLIKENYFQLTLSFSYRNFLFSNMAKYR
jgi:hypothetical protein